MHVLANAHIKAILIILCFSKTAYGILYCIEDITIPQVKVKNDHRSKFSNLSNWKEEA